MVAKIRAGAGVERGIATPHNCVFDLRLADVGVGNQRDPASANAVPISSNGHATLVNSSGTSFPAPRPTAKGAGSSCRERSSSFARLLLGPLGLALLL
jgi:hypothetical protein